MTTKETTNNETPKDPSKIDEEGSSPPSIGGTVLKQQEGG